MGFRRSAGDPFAAAPEGLLETSLRLIAGQRPAHPVGEETEFPPIDVFETAGEVVIEAELPGVEPATIGVSAGEGLVVIEGVKADDPGTERVNFLCMERCFGVFRRVVLPGAAVDLLRATASCGDGLLQVRLPKIEEKRGGVRAVPVAARRREGGER